jgi:hypothetical protein
MARLSEFLSALRYGHKIYPEDLVDGGGLPLSNSKVLYVDGDKSVSGGGTTWDDAFSTIQEAVTAASAGDVIYISERTISVTGTDPVSYAETIIIPNSKPHLSLIGVSRGLTQGGLPQIKIGAGTTALLTVRAPGCLIANLGFNGADSTGGGIKLEDNGTTYVAFGTTIVNCHFKNCKAHATNGKLGGAVYSTGSPWQIRISGCRFYKNVAGIVMVNTSYSVPQDWIIEDNVFGNSVNTETDGDIYVAADGILGLVIRNNSFDSVDGCAGTSGTILHYIELGAGTYGIMTDNTFACKTGSEDTPLTFGASTHTACKIPATVRMARNYGEGAIGSKAGSDGIVYRQD